MVCGLRVPCARIRIPSALPVSHIWEIQCGLHRILGQFVPYIREFFLVSYIFHLGRYHNAGTHIQKFVHQKTEQPMSTHNFSVYLRHFVHRIPQRNNRVPRYQSFAFFVPATPVMTLLLNKKSGYLKELFPPPILAVLQAPPSTLCTSACGPFVIIGTKVDGRASTHQQVPTH